VRHVRAQALNECHTVVGIKAHLVRETVAEGPDDEIGCARVLERTNFGIVGQIADAIAGTDRDALIAVMQQAVTGRDDQDLLPSSWRR
jgi:hypothetical protein